MLNVGWRYKLSPSFRLLFQTSHYHTRKSYSAIVWPNKKVSRIEGAEILFSKYVGNGALTDRRRDRRTDSSFRHLIIILKSLTRQLFSQIKKASRNEGAEILFSKFVGNGTLTDRRRDGRTDRQTDATKSLISLLHS